jgi:iron(III) transport system ATP-binding protein
MIDRKAGASRAISRAEMPGVSRLNAQDLHQHGRVPAGVTFAARLAFENISHSFGPGAETLRGVTLAAEPGEVLCLLGPSGSGKTTLLRIAAGI